MDKCPSCRAVLFKAVPGETTQEEIIKFARHAKLPEAELILAEGWIHPGEYCPNGCAIILINYGDDGLSKELEEEFEKTHVCHITIKAANTLPLPLSSYKIYIDGNIVRTRDKDEKPKNGEFARETPGDHRIVVRESDVKKPNRLESNTFWFTAEEGTPLHFEVGMTHEGLELRKS